MRRLRPVTSLALALSAPALALAPVLAQDFNNAFAPPQAVPRIVSEFRFGAIGRDSWGPERGSVSLSGELLLAKPFTAADLFTSYFIPRPAIGGALNLRGETSFAYAGLSWTFDVAPRVFVEASFGGAVQDGSGAKIVPLGRQAAGCTPQFREAGAVGVRLSTNWSLMATVERLSDYGLCGEARGGLTNVGARLGYTF